MHHVRFAEPVLGGGGFIVVPEPEKFGLTGGFPIVNDEGNEVKEEGYGISMFHQIHCLVSLHHNMHVERRGI